jgi:hypothetical protein
MGTEQCLPTARPHIIFSAMRITDATRKPSGIPDTPVRPHNLWTALFSLFFYG